MTTNSLQACLEEKWDKASSFYSINDENEEKLTFDRIKLSKNKNKNPQTNLIQHGRQ